MDLINEGIIFSLVAQLKRARQEALLSDHVVACAAYTAADDVIAFAQGMSCGDQAVQVSPGRLSGAVVKLDICGARFGYTACDRDIILEDSGRHDGAVLHMNDNGSKIELIGRAKLLALPSQSRAWVFIGSDVVPAHAGSTCGYSVMQPSPALLRRATNAVLQALAARCHGNMDKVEIRLRQIDVLTILDAFAAGLLRANDVISSRTSDTLLHLVRIVSAHASFRVDDLAEDLNMTRRNLHYCATRNIGISPKRLVKSVALRNVMHALPDAVATGKAIGDLAFEHGFDNFSHFCHDYRTLFGERPSETAGRYRQKQGACETAP